MKQNSARFLIALIMVLVGISLILRASGVEFSLFFTGWWAALMMVIAIVSMANGDISPGNFALLALGTWFLADQRGWIPRWFNTTYLIGAGIIGFGLLFLLSPKREKTTRESARSREPEYRRYTTQSRPHRKDGSSSPSYTAVFSGQDIRNVVGDFTGATLFALFGGLTIDLRKTQIVDGSIIDATAIFGGIDIKVPAGVRVIVQATPLFGGVDDNSPEPRAADAPTVTVRCLVAFGGVDIT